MHEDAIALLVGKAGADELRVESLSQQGQLLIQPTPRPCKAKALVAARSRLLRPEGPRPFDRKTGKWVPLQRAKDSFEWSGERKIHFSIEGLSLRSLAERWW